MFLPNALRPQADYFANPSLEPTRYGMRRKAGLRYSVHYLSPALQRMPPRAAQLER